MSNYQEDKMKLIKNKQKSNEKFDQLVSPQINKLYKFLCAYTKDLNLAQDILQDCLIKAYINLSALKDESKISSWLYKIAVNCAKDSFKNNVFESCVEVEVASEGNSYTKTEMKHDISQYLMRLTSDEREIIILKDMLDYSYDEISEFLGISQSNVGVRLYRARDKFKELIYNTEYSSKEGKF